MANSGPNSNNSQLYLRLPLSSLLTIFSYITYKSAPHLDGKHTVFGKLVGGEAVLRAMELTRTNEEDRPLVNIQHVLLALIVIQKEIKILKAVAYLNPFSKEEMANEAKEERKKREPEKVILSLVPPMSLISFF